MRANARENAAVIQTLVKLQSAMLMLAALAVYFLDALSIGKILALGVLFAVFSIVAYVHLQRRHDTRSTC